MATATFTPFHCLLENLAEKVHNLGSDDLKVYLSNAAPNQATHTAYDGVTGTTGPAEIANGNGYVTGGKSCAITSSSVAAGVNKLVLADPATWTGTGAGFGPFRYAVLYNNTATGKNLLGWWDYGSTITLVAANETFFLDLDPSAGVLTLTVAA
jgi:hypothetical protein